MTKHKHDDDEECPWCRERAVREQDENRMNAMAEALRDLLDCNTSGSADDVFDRVQVIVDKLHPNAIDACDALLIAANINSARAAMFNTLAEKWSNDIMMEWECAGDIVCKTIQ